MLALYLCLCNVNCIKCDTDEKRKEKDNCRKILFQMKLEPTPLLSCGQSYVGLTDVIILISKTVQINLLITTKIWPGVRKWSYVVCAFKTRLSEHHCLVYFLVKTNNLKQPLVSSITTDGLRGEKDATHKEKTYSQPWEECAIKKSRHSSTLQDTPTRADTQWP